MQITVTFRHMESSDALKDYAHDKIQKVVKHLPQAVSAHVIMWVEKLSHCAEIFIDAGSIHCRKTGRSDDMYKSIDEATDKLNREVKKHREKIHSFKRRTPAGDVSFAHQILALPVENDTHKDGHHVLETKQMNAEKMSIDEAVMQLDLSHEDFLVYQSLDSQQLNILYRRKDDHYGLIQTVIK